MSKPSTGKTSGHNSSAYYGVTIYYFLMFLSRTIFEFQAFHHVLFRNITIQINKKFLFLEVYVYLTQSKIKTRLSQGTRLSHSTKD